MKKQKETVYEVIRVWMVYAKSPVEAIEKTRNWDNCETVSRKARHERVSYYGKPQKRKGRA